MVRRRTYVVGDEFAPVMVQVIVGQSRREVEVSRRGIQPKGGDIASEDSGQ
jgi:hypothetical protein